jgi:hypothetical protein
MISILQIESLSLTFHGHDLIVDSELELNYGRYKRIAITLFQSITMKGAISHIIDAFIWSQAIWFAWIEWLWQIYPSHSNRL